MIFFARSILLFATFSLLIGCTSSVVKKSKTTQNIQQTTLKTFSVDKQIVSSTDTIRISLPESFPSKLSIQSPDGQLYIIHSEEDQIALLPYKAFKTATFIDIPVSSVKGVAWIDGNKLQEKVFKRKGKYKLYMANNLETEPDNTFHFKKGVEFR